MSREPTQVSVAVHADIPGKAAILVSIDGENANGKWIARSQIGSMHLTGKTTQGTDRYGTTVTLAMANITIPEWLAKQEGFI
jgi:hypothetical protein